MHLLLPVYSTTRKAWFCYLIVILVEILTTLLVIDNRSYIYSPRLGFERLAKLVESGMRKGMV